MTILNEKTTGRDAALWIVGLGVIIVSLTGPLRAEQSNEVSGTYKVWMSQSGSGVPYVPQQDCVRFPGDGRMHVDSCSLSGRGQLLSNQGTRWTGITPCVDGLIQILWIGTSFNGSDFEPDGVDAISAVGVRLDLPGNTTAFQGFRDENCSIFLP